MHDASQSRPMGWPLDLVVFICGALVMVYEIVGSRILAPFIGTSTYVWTSLIGVILGALSLGYWLGGRLADEKPNVKILASAILTAAALVSVTTITKEVVLSAIASLPFWLEIKAVLAALLLFAPASVALGFVTPFAVRLRMASVGDAGKTVGRLYALSTIGSIVGTFAAGFILLPFVGSVRTLYLIAGSLFLLSLLLVPFSLSRKHVSVLLLLLLGITATELWRQMLWRSNELIDLDTEYTRVQIYRATDTATERPIRALSFDPFSTQSAMFLDSDELVFEYTKFYHLIRSVKPDFQRTLMIGGAGYSFPKSYLATYPNAELEVIEIDPGMTRIAREHFRLTDDPRMSIRHEDGRVFLNNAETARYDAVLMDAFGSLFSIPFHLTTVEAVRHVHRVLKDDGVAIFNVGSAITGPASNFLQAEFRTYQEVFPQVHLFKVRPERPDTELQNLIVLACKTQCLPASPTNDQLIDSFLTRRHISDFPLTRPILTDDLAPTERYSSIAQAQ
jgi:spermidine synthase